MQSSGVPDFGTGGAGSFGGNRGIGVGWSNRREPPAHAADLDRLKVEPIAAQNRVPLPLPAGRAIDRKFAWEIALPILAA
jgi:hypothetical protein